MAEWFERSAAGRFLNTAGSAPVRLLRSPATGKLRRWGALLPGQWFLAAGTGLMLCVPHEYWNNLYGVLFALTALLLYWWDTAAAAGAALNPAVLGAGGWIYLLLSLLSPLWSAFPWRKTRRRVGAAMPVTTPICVFSYSRTFPCSI